MTVEIRTTTGLGRCRAGLALGPTWGTFEVTPEQLAELRADHALEVRTPQAEVEAKAALVDEAGAEVEQLRAQVAALEEQLGEATRARLEAEQMAHEALADNEALSKEVALLRIQAAAPAPVAPPAPPAPEA